jgi:hypothetical protein
MQRSSKPVGFRPPRVEVSQKLSQSNPAVEREIARRWRRHKFKNAANYIGGILTFVIVLLFIMLWIFKYTLLRLFIRGV